MTTTQGIKLDDNTRQRLKTLAAVRKRTPHWLMCEAIEDYLTREELYEKEKREDQERWEHYQLTGEAVSHEAATKWLKGLSQGKVKKCPR